MTTATSQQMKCQTKHTEYQPIEWRCPKCGAEEPELAIECFNENADYKCRLLHEYDKVHCHVCDREWTGHFFAIAMKRYQEHRQLL